MPDPRPGLGAGCHFSHTWSRHGGAAGPEPAMA